MTGTWTLAAQRPAPPICGLVDGRVLHIADILGKRTHETWLYEPSSDTYREIAPVPWRAWHPAAIGTAEGWVAMLGGSVDHAATARCSIYEPARDTWSEMPPMPEPREDHQLVLTGGRLYVVAGSSAKNDPRPNVWSWGPGEEWRCHPDLPIRAASTCGLSDGSFVAWSKWSPGPLVRFDGAEWTTLAVLARGVEIVATDEGLLAIGAETETQTHVQAWSKTGWVAHPELSKPRCFAEACRLADGRTVVLAGQRDDHYWEDNSSGGEIDLEYRSFSRTKVYGHVDCQDLELETPTGWSSFAVPFKGEMSRLIHPLSDGRLLVAQRYMHGVYANHPKTYLWTPPP